MAEQLNPKPRHRNWRPADSRPIVICRGGMHSLSSGTRCPACTPSIYAEESAKHRNQTIHARDEASA